MVSAIDFDTLLVSAMKIALSKARELGYPIEAMELTVASNDMEHDFHFCPVARPGNIVMGGDLVIAVDRNSLEIVKLRDDVSGRGSRQDQPVRKSHAVTISRNESIS